MAGLSTLFTCCFVVFFHTRYRRLETGTNKESNGSIPTEHAPSVQGWSCWDRDRGSCVLFKPRHSCFTLFYDIGAFCVASFQYFNTLKYFRFLHKEMCREEICYLTSHWSVSWELIVFLFCFITLKHNSHIPHCVSTHIDSSKVSKLHGVPVSSVQRRTEECSWWQNPDVYRRCFRSLKRFQTSDSGETFSTYSASRRQRALTQQMDEWKAFTEHDALFFYTDYLQQKYHWHHSVVNSAVAVSGYFSEMIYSVCLKQTSSHLVLSKSIVSTVWSLVLLYCNHYQRFYYCVNKYQ